MDKIVVIGEPIGVPIDVRDYTGKTASKDWKWYIRKSEVSSKYAKAYVCDRQTITINERGEIEIEIHLHTSFASWDCTPEELKRDWIEVENPLV